MINEFEYLVLTIVDCPLPICSKELEGFLKIGVTSRYSVNEDFIDLKKVYKSSPPPGGSHMSKILLWEPENLRKRTAFFANYEDGRYTLILNYCRDFKHKAVQISYTKSTAANPSFKLYYFDFTNNNEIERCISLIKDVNEWIFFTKGPQQEFETPNNYEKRKKIERFNSEVILDYLLRLDIDIKNEKFWQSKDKGVYFTQNEW